MASGNKNNQNYMLQLWLAEKVKTPAGQIFTGCNLKMREGQKVRKVVAHREDRTCTIYV